MVTIVILLITAAVSLINMNNDEFRHQYMFNAWAIKHRKEWYRFFTAGLLHADFAHLAFNMLALYSFGAMVEDGFCSEALFGPKLGHFMFSMMYVSGLAISSIYSYFKHKDNILYNALGASGAVSAVVYSAILFHPNGTIYFIVIPIKSWLFGILYLVASYVMARKNVGNIGHDAHFWGAVYGFIFPIIFFPFLIQRFIALLVP
jgi:membrane associated rhomboid family serine protease